MDFGAGLFRHFIQPSFCGGIRPKRIHTICWGCGRIRRGRIGAAVCMPFYSISFVRYEAVVWRAELAPAVGFGGGLVAP